MLALLRLRVVFVGEVEGGSKLCQWQWVMDGESGGT